MKLSILECKVLTNFCYELEYLKTYPVHRESLLQFLALENVKNDSNVEDVISDLNDLDNVISDSNEIIDDVFELNKSENKLSNSYNIDELFSNPEFLNRIRNFYPPYAYGGGLSEHQITSIIDNKLSQILTVNPKYFGPNSDGNWRIQQIGDELITEYKYMGIWLTQCVCKATNLSDSLIITEDEIPIVTEDLVHLTIA